MTDRAARSIKGHTQKEKWLIHDKQTFLSCFHRLISKHTRCTWHTLVRPHVPHVYSTNETYKVIDLARTNICDKWTSAKQMSNALETFLSLASPSPTYIETITCVKAAVQLQIAPDLKLGEKRAEVLKVSRRSDHLYESCAVKHRSPRELLLPTLQSLNKTLPWLYFSLPSTELSFRHMQQKAACLHGLDAKPSSVQYGAVQHDTKRDDRVRQSSKKSESAQ